MIEFWTAINITGLAGVFCLKDINSGEVGEVIENENYHINKSKYNNRDLVSLLLH